MVLTWKAICHGRHQLVSSITKSCDWRVACFSFGHLKVHLHTPLHLKGSDFAFNICRSMIKYLTGITFQMHTEQGNIIYMYNISLSVLFLFSHSKSSVKSSAIRNKSYHQRSGQKQKSSSKWYLWFVLHSSSTKCLSTPHPRNPWLTTSALAGVEWTWATQMEID